MKPENQPLTHLVEIHIAKRKAFFAHREIMEEKEAKFRHWQQQASQRAQEVDAQAQEHQKYKKEKADAEKAYWEKKKVEDAEIRVSVMHKMTLPVGKRAFTAREKAYWARTRGTKLPKGC